MELQWPLILFTTLVAWSAGLFGTQALLAAGGHNGGGASRMLRVKRSPPGRLERDVIPVLCHAVLCFTQGKAPWRQRPPDVSRETTCRNGMRHWCKCFT